ncbi:MAG: protein kinase [Deltaproteobacteria bacterium]|nr:protein kinase [Deltaproteobacteria bacterium]
MQLAVGTDIDGRYVVEGHIGSGGMAEVYRVRHHRLGTLCALKVLTMTKRAVQRRLMQEGRVQATLQHPNIVRVSDLFLIGDAPCLVMEYVRGPSIEASKPSSPTGPSPTPSSTRWPAACWTGWVRRTPSA